MDTVETPRDRRLSELYAELGKVVESLVDDAKECAMDNPAYTSTLADRVRLPKRCRLLSSER
jgi:hypothetical protein